LISDLATGFGIERRLVEHQLDVHSRIDTVDDLMIYKQTDHSSVSFQVFVTNEARTPLFEQGLISRWNCALLRTFPTGARAAALFIHLALETLAIDFEATLSRHVFLRKV
jgi:hypothetical protein